MDRIALFGSPDSKPKKNEFLLRHVQKISEQKAIRSDKIQWQNANSNNTFCMEQVERMQKRKEQLY